jgi:predicted alpha/beta superfamily hydrolase
MSFLNKDHPTMYSEDYEEWRWGQILTRRADYNPDDEPPTDEDEEDAQTQE